MKHHYVTATEFKAKCLAFLTEVDQHGGSITVTKRGRPVARIAPVPKKPFKSPRGAWKGKVEIVGDIVNYTMGEWEVQSDPGTMTRKGKR